MIFRRSGAPPLVVGHRGVRGEGAPIENTLEAFARAKREGADAIELDVRTCASGEPIVLHDPTLARVTGDRDARPAGALPLDVLRRVDLGGGARVPTLTDVLDFARGAGLAVNVEMKHDAHDRGAVVRAVAEIVRDDGTTIVSSFHPAMLLAFARKRPEIPRALILHESGNERAALAAMFAMGPSFVHALHLARAIATPARIARLARRGFIVGVWTINDAEEVARFGAARVDSIITDRPAEARAALSAR